MHKNDKIDDAVEVAKDLAEVALDVTTGQVIEAVTDIAETISDMKNLVEDFAEPTGNAMVVDSTEECNCMNRDLHDDEKGNSILNVVVNTVTEIFE